MRVNDIFAIENGEHIRILLCSEEQCYAVSCQHFRMPFLLSAHELKGMKSISDEEYTIFTIDDDISAAQRCERDRRFALIKPLLDNACIYDKPHRNEIVNQIVGEHGVSRRTVLQYLWKYWVYKSKNILLPTGRTSAKARELTADEKAIRWALNKYYYTPQKQSLQTAYKMMLRAKFCDAHGTLKAEYPTFWQFRYFFRQHRDPISETISRQGLKAYQRNHRPFTGSICDYAHTIGVYMTDATVADIYIVSRLSRKPIGRPVIYTMVDAYSRLITGVYVGLEGGQYTKYADILVSAMARLRPKRLTRSVTTGMQVRSRRLPPAPRTAFSPLAAPAAMQPTPLQFPQPATSGMTAQSLSSRLVRLTARKPINLGPTRKVSPFVS